MSGVLFANSAAAAPVTEHWTGESPYFYRTSAPGGTVGVVSMNGPDDGRALQLRLGARPGTGPGNGVEISSNEATYRYGTYGTRIRTADCTGQGRLGVVTGTFTYSTDHSDGNGNGLPDNDEIDIEVLCAQPHVVWLTIWTDYDGSVAPGQPIPVRKISRAIDMRTGKVLHNCYMVRLGGDCQPELPGENSPASVTPVPGFDSSTQFRTFMFDWQPDSVTFWGYDDSGRRNVLWDYRGPASRIPDKPSAFMQNVWHTNEWDPLDGPAREQPQTAVSAYVDSTTLPR
ncbi:glycoside hydrolase family 16 protein [Streptomyces radiopugnans]|uniref:Glycosyl hydrolases family 16 n=1 Tax=Streptomyces radiopugnans TaxID=403935 RepID=A0A1H9B3Y7_9ACTN|nr:glycoside hydrolase family 16 protein [Streptomyces radiopugnans]SEP83431.1 Glycosyl hydrolases family 16 [Streptomyces radiopugnans]